INEEPLQQFKKQGGVGVGSLNCLIKELQCPRIIWLMVPSGRFTDNLIEELIPMLKAGDIVIDGGNSHYKKSLRNHEILSNLGIHFFDVGTSGGISGARSNA